MPERPLLILPGPGEPKVRQKKAGGGRPPHLPSRDRQVERLEPQFMALQQAIDARRANLRTEATGLVPEEVIVLETVGAIDNFIVAVRNVEGLEWLGEVEEEDIPPDDDFFFVDQNDQRYPDKSMRGRAFLVLSNQQAFQQLLSLWANWKAAQPLLHGLAKWGKLFAQLRDVRPWGVHDRLDETGVLENWRERVEHNEEMVPCEIELWYRHDPQRRQGAKDRVASIITNLNGSILRETVIEEIAYHALLVRLLIGSVQSFLDEARRDVELLQCEQIQFFRASGQMAGIIVDDERSTDTVPATEPMVDLKEPVVALFDGLPLQNHQRLAGRLIVDDPDGFEPEYQASDRRHGTAMASLILHGDLGARDQPLQRKLYVRPILRPRDWPQQPRPEIVPEEMLVVDLIHRAVRRLFEGDGNEPPTAQQVCVVNLSIGIKDRPFDRTMSPLARLLDWLSWKYKVLFNVSSEISGSRNRPTR